MKNLKTKKIISLIVISTITLVTITFGNMMSEETNAAIESPSSIRAISVKNEYIRVNWNAVSTEYMTEKNIPVQYEVYVIEDGTRTYLGTTLDTGFIFKNLKKNTNYEFLVRALDTTGSSDMDTFYKSNMVRLGNEAGNLDKDGALAAHTKAEKKGNTANIIIGNDILSNKMDYIVDLTREELAGSKDVMVSIPVKVALNQNVNRIKIIANDYTISFTPNAFENSVIKANKDRDDAGIKFKVSQVNQNLILKNTEDRSLDVVSKKYLLEASAFVGSTAQKLYSLNGNMDLIVDYDLYRSNTRRLKTIKLVRYNSFDKTYKTIGNGEGGTALGKINELGTYLTIGSRR